MILRSCGDRAILVEYTDLAETMAFFPSLRRTAPEDVEDLVPAARTILVRHNGNSDRVAAWIRAAEPADHATAPITEPVVITVRYDGDDLADVADLTGLTAREVIRAHTEQVWTVAFCGFAPGFGYLVGTDDRLHVPRRSAPRTTVPAGSVGLAGEFSGVYPRSSPGGWQLIGRSDTELWDVARTPPALLQPGTTVRFEQV